MTLCKCGSTAVGDKVLGRNPELHILFDRVCVNRNDVLVVCADREADMITNGHAGVGNYPNDGTFGREVYGVQYFFRCFVHGGGALSVGAVADMFSPVDPYSLALFHERQ